MKKLKCKELELELSIDSSNLLFDKSIYYFEYNNYGFISSDNLDELEKKLKGYLFYEAEYDKYEGFLILNISLANIKNIAKQFNQDFIIYANLNETFNLIKLND